MIAVFPPQTDPPSNFGKYATPSMGKREQRHAALVARLVEVRRAQRELQVASKAFAADASAPEKRAVSQSLQELLQFSPEVTVLGAQTGAVVERIANANDVAEKMTREVRRLDIVQSRMAQCLAQSGKLLTLRNSLAGIRRAMQQRDYAEAAAFLRELKAVERAMALDAADKLRLDTTENDLKTVIEASFEAGLRVNDARQIQRFAPLFQATGIGRAYEERGFAQLLSFVEAVLEQQLAPFARGTFSTKELMEQLATVFNQIAAVEQEYGALVRQCFQHVGGANRLLAKLYAAGEKYAVLVLNAYMQQRKFLQRMNKVEAMVDPSGGGATSTDASSPTGSGNMQEDDVAVMNEQLNEIALVIQHTQTYERFMRSRVVAEPVDSDQTKQEQDQQASTNTDETIQPLVPVEVLPPSHESELGKTVQELAGFYCYFENDLLNRAARKAFQWEELRYSSSSSTDAAAGAVSVTDTSNEDGVVCFPISSAVDEIFYVARNSGLRALATGHSDCAAGVLNMINTLLRDVLGDAMRNRIRNMAAFIKFESETSLLAASNQLRDQMQQQLAKFSKTMGPIPLQIPMGGGLTSASGMMGSSTSLSSLAASGNTTTANTSGNSSELRKECGPDVVMNSLEATTEYIAQIKAQFADELGQDFADVPPHLLSCLNGLEDASMELSQLLSASRKKLLKLLEPKISGALGALLAPPSSKRPGVSYELTEQQFTFNEANDPFAQAFVAGMRALLGSFRATLSPANYREVAELAARSTAALVEKWFDSRGSRFNQLGALQFDKDLRVLGAFFNEACDAREAFAVLTQMASVLSVDALEDVPDVFGRASRGVAWKLSAARVKEILSRRVEFADAAINKLVLSS